MVRNGSISGSSVRGRGATWSKRSESHRISLTIIILLVDSNRFTPAKMHMVVGSHVIPKILTPGLKTNVGGSLVSQTSISGWILSRPALHQLKIAQNSIFGWTLSAPVFKEVPYSLLRWLKPVQNQSITMSYSTRSFKKKKHISTQGRSLCIIQAIHVNVSEIHCLLALQNSSTTAISQHGTKQWNERWTSEHLLSSFAGIYYIMLGYIEPTDSRENIRIGKYFSFYPPLRPEVNLQKSK